VCQLKLINDMVNVVGSANRVGFRRKRGGDHWCENVGGSARLSGRGSDRDCRKKENGKAHQPKNIHGQIISRVKIAGNIKWQPCPTWILPAGKGNDILRSLKHPLNPPLPYSLDDSSAIWASVKSQAGSPCSPVCPSKAAKRSAS